MSQAVAKLIPECGPPRSLCDAQSQQPVAGTCETTVPGACTNLNLGSQTYGLGVCARTVSRCVGGVPNECVPGPAGPEVCNALDDDCDGGVDANDPEDLVSAALRLCERQLGVCGGAGKPAALCVAGQRGSCGDAVYLAHDGRYQAPRETSCDGVDNDCDGVADDDFTMVGRDGRSLAGVGADCGTGRCAVGVTRCAAGGAGIECSTEGLAVAEVCNGVDDDCDGVTDVADPDLARVACEEQRGVCAGSIKPLALCGASGWGTCGAAAYAGHSVDHSAGSEAWCDGKDNDYDGSTDEDFVWSGPGGQVVVAVGQPCGLGRCAGGVTQCNGAGNGLVCSTAGMAVAETCNGVDDHCGGLTDAEDPSMAVPSCENQAGACAGAKKPLSLCGGTSGSGGSASSGFWYGNAGGAGTLGGHGGGGGGGGGYDPPSPDRRGAGGGGGGAGGCRAPVAGTSGRAGGGASGSSGSTRRSRSRT